MKLKQHQKKPLTINRQKMWIKNTNFMPCSNQMNTSLALCVTVTLFIIKETVFHWITLDWIQRDWK